MKAHNNMANMVSWGFRKKIYFLVGDHNIKYQADQNRLEIK